MNPLFLVALPALVILVPPPSPTPGLGVVGQQINYEALTQGHVIKKATVDGSLYTVRAVGDNILLYNSVDHVILISKIVGPECNFALGAFDGDPYPGKWPSGDVTLDRETFDLRLVMQNNRPILAVYNHLGHIVFALLDADPNLVIVPRPLKSL